MNTSNKFAILLFSILSSSLSGCSYLGPSDPIITGTTVLTKQEKAQLSYVSVAPVFKQNCTSCHGSAGGINLESYQGIRQNLVAIERAVFKTKTMPKGFSISADQAQVLKAWIEMGAPEQATGGGTLPTPAPSSTPLPTSTPSPTATPEPEELEATFKSIRQNILAKRCIFCHSGNGSAKHIPLSTLEDLIDSPREIVLPGNADESSIVIAVERSDDKRMPPRDSGSALSSEEIRVIREWITNGASD